MSQLKRQLQAQTSKDEEEDDETPLFSPSPSDTDEEEGQGASLDRMLSSTNVGRNLLIKMGWKEGSGLGVGGFGRVDPVPVSEKRGGDLTGIGKSSLDTRAIASSTANRRTMESERQMLETEQEREERFATVESRQAQKEQVMQALKTYRCELCQKQYDRPSTFETHLNSYDHHHKKRFNEMKANHREKSEASGLVDKKREREKKREAKEMAKMAQAAGVQLGGQASSLAKPPPASSSPATTLMGVVGASSSNSSSSGGGWKKVINTKVTSAPKPLMDPPSLTNARSLADLSPVKSAQVAEKKSTSFQSSGFSTLDTSRPERQGPSPNHPFSTPLTLSADPSPPPPPYDVPPPPQGAPPPPDTPPPPPNDAPPPPPDDAPPLPPC